MKLKEYIGIIEPTFPFLPSFVAFYCASKMCSVFFEWRNQKRRGVKEKYPTSKSNIIAGLAFLFLCFLSYVFPSVICPHFPANYRDIAVIGIQLRRWNRILRYFPDLRRLPSVSPRTRLRKHENVKKRNKYVEKKTGVRNVRKTNLLKTAYRRTKSWMSSCWELCIWLVKSWTSF